MPQQAWSTRRERQYRHIKQGLKKRGRKEDVAEEIAKRRGVEGRSRMTKKQLERALSRSS